MLMTQMLLGFCAILLAGCLFKLTIVNRNLCEIVLLLCRIAGNQEGGPIAPIVMP